MTIKLIINSIILLLASVTSLLGQWDEYEAVWKGRPGMMYVHMEAESVPYKDKLIYLAEVEVAVTQCDASGYPQQAEDKLIDQQLIKIDSLISTERYGLDVGRIYYQCKVKEYIYVEDTIGLRGSVAESFDSEYSLRLVADKDWKIYKDFVYPDEYLIQTMANKKIINILQAEGFDLDIKKTLTHFAAFASEEDRKKYRRFILEQNFEVISQEVENDAPLAYLINFSRWDKLQLEQISNITLRLHQKSEYLNGRYQGWEIEVE